MASRGCTREQADVFQLFHVPYVVPPETALYGSLGRCDGTTEHEILIEQKNKKLRINRTRGMHVYAYSRVRENSVPLFQKSEDSFVF